MFGGSCSTGGVLSITLTRVVRLAEDFPSFALNTTVCWPKPSEFVTLNVPVVIGCPAGIELVLTSTPSILIRYVSGSPSSSRTSTIKGMALVELIVSSGMPESSGGWLTGGGGGAAPTGRLITAATRLMQSWPI